MAISATPARPGAHSVLPIALRTMVISPTPARQTLLFVLPIALPIGITMAISPTPAQPDAPLRIAYSSPYRETALWGFLQHPRGQARLSVLPIALPIGSTMVIYPTPVRPGAPLRITHSHSCRESAYYIDFSNTRAARRDFAYCRKAKASLPYREYYGNNFSNARAARRAFVYMYCR